MEKYLPYTIISNYCKTDLGSESMKDRAPQTKA